MASANGLVALFEAMTRNLEQDRAHINSIDRGDGDTGDNMAANFRLITNSLQKQLGQGHETDIGKALNQAAKTLQHQGQGATAPIYAQGLVEAGNRLAGQTNFSLDDLVPLLEGLLTGANQASGNTQGAGSLIDVLLPGIMTYLQSKRAGQSDMEAILTALLNLRRGAFGTAQSPTGYGRSSGTDTTGQIDPGAAGAASLLEGLFGAILRQVLQGGGLGGLAGGLPQQQPAPHNLPSGRTSPQPAPQTIPSSGDNPFPLPNLPGGLGDLLGGLLGGGGQSAPDSSSSSGTDLSKHKYT
ncbi:hypothetical protein SE17_08125 [Kouleothrix aurantiaca]|jgi:dihydroxyacetone kinase|uniref:DhaL domain-containing protein n=1 Tax=Kouleothrix aurantiaca TaxID=186479 RepID=A0A0N8PSU4_9CHLR|nr:hypothetical protein SE17_08125 [Kouleothrix aurantiaca]